MRLGHGVDGFGRCFVVDSDRNPHEAIAEGLNHFQAVVFIDRIKRRYAKSSRNPAPIQKTHKH